MGAQRQIAWEPDDGAHAGTDAYYRSQWRAYGFRRAVALFFVYTWVPVTVGLLLVSRLSVHQPALAGSVILVWLGAAVGLVYWSGEFRCPRCRRRYGALGHRKGDVNLTRGIFDKVCANCKLRKFERVR